MSLGNALKDLKNAEETLKNDENLLIVAVASKDKEFLEALIVILNRAHDALILDRKQYEDLKKKIAKKKEEEKKKKAAEAAKNSKGSGGGKR